MTDRKQAMQDLLAKVEAGDWNSAYDEPAKETGLQDWALTIDKLMDEGSLDAAKALHEAVLPGWDGSFSLDSVAAVWSSGPTYVGRSTNPARAWLIAIIKALIAQDAETDRTRRP